MKKKYLLLILVPILCNLTNARNWDMLKPDKHWNILQITYNPDLVHHDSTTYYIKFNGDTIINTRKYYRVLQATDLEFINSVVNGYVREDTLVGLYYRNFEGQEDLLYKYNLNLGDKVVLKNNSITWLDSVRYLVTGIDSILIDGRYKRRYTMTEKHYEYMPETWVEGVGSSLGILGCGNIVAGGATRLLCCYENNILIYKNPDYQDCYYSTHTALNSVINSESEISVYLATTNNIFIKSPIDNFVKIFNSNGMFVESIQVSANQEYKLNVSKYSKGTYLISPSTNLFAAKKFIIY